MSCKSLYLLSRDLTKKKFQPYFDRLDNTYQGSTRLFDPALQLPCVIYILFSRQNKLLSRLEIVTAYKGKENAVIRYANEQGLTIHSWPLTIALSDFDIGLVVSFGYLIPGQIIRAFPMYVFIFNDISLSSKIYFFKIEKHLFCAGG